MIKDLPRLALDEIPVEQMDAKEITKILKNGNKVVGYEIAGEFSVTLDEAIELAREGKLKNIGIAHNKDTVYLKSIPDSNNNNNLSNLPSENR